MVGKNPQKLKKRHSVATQGSQLYKDNRTGNGDKQSGPAAPEHVRRKVARQSKFMHHIIDTHQKILSAKTSKLKKKRKRKPAALADLSSLSGALQDAARSDGVASEKCSIPKGLGVGGCKQRMRICDKETDRLQRVLAHPQFKSDPIAAVTAHLAATLPPKPPLPRNKPSKSKGDPGSKHRHKAHKQRQQLMQTD